MPKRLLLLSAVLSVMCLAVAAQTSSDTASNSLKSVPATSTVGLPSLAPTARAGQDQPVEVGRRVYLDGSRSTNPQALRLRYEWSLLQVPSGSSAFLSAADSVAPSFVPDVPGTYVAQLLVTDGIHESTANVVVVARTAKAVRADGGNPVAPVANAGANQEVATGAIVELDGSASTDANGHALTYLWSLVSVPTGSEAKLSSTTTIRPTFTVDLSGSYVAQLVVNDGSNSSTPAQVIISTVAIPPTANAGPDQLITQGATVTLNGSASTDPNNEALTYAWSLSSVPPGSSASLTGAAAASASFTADLAGNYVAQLIVSDSYYPSAPSTALISTSNLPPVANPGNTAAVPAGTIVGLDGSASSDPQSLPLTYSWALLSIPSGSAAVLSSTTARKPTFTADLSGIYVAQLIVNNGVQSSLPKTVVIYGLFPPSISVALTQPNLITYSATTGAVHLSNPAANTGGSACAGQVIEISLGDGSLGTLSTSSANPATSVCVPMGKQDAPFTLTSNSRTGSTLVSGFATNFQTGTTGVSVNARQITLSFDTVSVGQGRVANGTVLLAYAAPAGGVTIDLGTSESSIASLSTASVAIAAGATSASFQVNALATGTSLISATAVQAGYAASSVTITVLPPTLTITIPHGLNVGPGQSLPFPVNIGGPAAAPVTIGLATTAGPGSAILPASVVIPTGATTPATQPDITGGSLGNVTVAATAAGYGSDVETETVSVTLSANPSSVSVQAEGIGSTSNSSTLAAVNPATIVTVLINASSVAPAGGLLIDLAIANPAIASAPATVTMPAGASSVAVSIKGLSVGTTTLKASGGSGIVSTTVQITVYAQPAITIAGCPSTLAFNAVTTNYGCYAYLGAAAPLGGLRVTFTSSDPSLMSVSLNSTTVGGRKVTSNVTAGGSSSGTVYLAALKSSGTVTLTASTPGYTSSTFTVTLTPSGFRITGGAPTTSLSPASTVYVYFTGLDPVTSNPTNIAYLRAGATPVPVTLQDNNTPAGVGSLGAASVTINPGSYYTTTTFTPSAVGTANISIPSAPTVASYTQPSSSYVTTQFVVTKPVITIAGCPGTVGLNAVTTNYGCYASLGAPTPAGGETVTFTSSNPSLLTVSLDPAKIGSASVSFSLAGGSYSTGIVYLAALASSGTVTLTASAPDYTSGTFTVTLTPSGFRITGGTSTTTFSPPSTVYVYFTALDPATSNPTNSAYLRAGATPVPVTLQDDNTPAGVGSLGAASVTINPGSYYATTTFTPSAAGTANISIPSAPTGTPAYTQPSAAYITTQFVVTAPVITIAGCPGTLGLNAVTTNYGCYASLGAPAPAGGEAVTFTSSNPSLLTVSTDSTKAGSGSVTLNVAGQGSSTGVVYLAALAGSGTVTLTASAPGYTSGTFTVTLTPSGFRIAGGTPTTTFSPPSTVYVYFTALDPATSNPTNSAYLRAGATPVPVTLKDDNPGAGTLGAASVTVNPGSYYATTTFTPSPTTPGTVNISIPSAPSGTPAYTQPSATYITTQFVVTAPAITIAGCPSTLGMNAVTANYGCYAQLGAPAPSGGETVTFTSSNPSLLTVSLSSTTVGSPSVTSNVAAGASSTGVVYLAALASSGTVTLTASAPGYTSGTFTVTLTPSGFKITGGTATNTISPPSTVYVYFSALDSSTSIPSSIAYLRAGAAAVTVSLQDNNTPAGVGTLGTPSVTLNPGSYYATTTFIPNAAGTANVSIPAAPAGYTQPPAAYVTTQFVVTEPVITIAGCPGTLGLNAVTANYGCYASLSAAAPAGGETVTFTSSNPSLLTVSLSSTTVGSPSATSNVAAGGSSTGVVYLAALASSGTVTLTASAPGYTSGTFTVTLTPSGFRITGGTPTTTFSPPSTVYVYFTALDPVSFAPTSTAYLRAGAASVSVGLNDDNTAAGTLGATSVTVNPGSYYITTTFTPNSAGTGGTANISIPSAPAGGYAQPYFTCATTQFIVTAPPTSISPVTVGQNLMTQTFGTLGAAVPSNNYSVMVSVPSSSQLLLSKTGADAGTSSLTFILSQGQTQTPYFWVYGVGSPGQAQLNIAAAGYAPGTGTITIDPSGFVFNNQNFSTTLTAAPTTLYIQPAALDPQFLTLVAVQPIRPGLTTSTLVTVTLTDQSGTSPVGSITVNPVAFNGNDNPNEKITSFQPLNVGQTLLQLTANNGFSKSSSEVTATVTH